MRLDFLGHVHTLALEGVKTLGCIQHSSSERMCTVAGLETSIWICVCVFVCVCIPLTEITTKIP